MKPLHLSLLALVLAAPQALALKSDTQQPVYINSDTQQVDMKSNQVVFEGDVSLKQGSINIDADRIVVTRDPKTEAIKQIQAFGKPAKFSQLMDDGKTLSGQATELDYRISTDELTMKGQAQLAQDNNTIKGSSIRYQIGKQKLVADSSKEERVTTILQPNQIEN
ncbi:MULTISPECIES: lipopolysaccharide transport periplasmic protein LptA [Vibrio]|jgi:lipopolysaccharide export system protein LptA|uniref:Lipopolysaccharide export system protein LptA n=10 Tax=Vibrio TaxID=662 RepID=A0A0H0Y906_VIBAL|nr:MULTISPECIES: lipopolysaccharide transport periplasmic protein LptA [Vibrio]EEZ81656.1 putative ABC superfamily transport protein [Vibrio alginolyticus 40B]MDF5366501.1 lipopolysaccharide transport periplasmic protein LptA [Vibrio parahaemolyticus]MDW1810220.1 lipopolysaccharide transport periplasmic protein LptA [Vibrio sp. Vb2362]MDW2259749.1 lipopolysaccharide transport periplasmic protein LptA [Vibrio sp. 1409]MDW2296746.1 lipopolysaccharide transport periplasmic protein LptA [Vibrio sp